MKIDRNGWTYYDKLPDGYRLATIDDFHVKGKKKIGMGYIIQWATRTNYFEPRKITEVLSSEWLVPFIKANRVFVKIIDNE